MSEFGCWANYNKAAWYTLLCMLHTRVLEGDRVFTNWEVLEWAAGLYGPQHLSTSRLMRPWSKGDLLMYLCAYSAGLTWWCCVSLSSGEVCFSFLHFLHLSVSHQNSTIWITQLTGRSDEGFHTRTATTAQWDWTSTPPSKLWVSRSHTYTQRLTWL